MYSGGDACRSGRDAGSPARFLATGVGRRTRYRQPVRLGGSSRLHPIPVSPTPRPRRHRRHRLDPFAIPPAPADPFAPPPVDPLAPLPADLLAAPRPVDPFALPGVIPTGTRPDRTRCPLHRASRRSSPPSFNPINGSIAGAAKPIYINFAGGPIAGPPDGPGRGAHLVGPAGARRVLLDHRHPAALAAPGLLAGGHRGQHRRRRHQVERSPSPSSSSRPSTTPPTR